MNMTYWNPQFNAVGCGYIIAGILGGDGKSYFSKCSTMKGVIGVSEKAATRAPFENLFSWLGRSFLPRTQTAQVSSALSSSGTRELDASLILFAENFDRENPKGEIIDLEEEVVTSTSPGGLNWVERDGIWVMQLLDEEGVVFSEIPLPPKAELSVDDTTSPEQDTGRSPGSVALSVNGATDGIGVKKGEEAEVKWTGSETIVSCRGSWNPTERLSASGTANVVVLVNGTVTIGCLDAAGNTVTASVIVTAVNPPLFATITGWIRERFAASSSSETAFPVIEQLSATKGPVGTRIDIQGNDFGTRVTV